MSIKVIIDRQGANYVLHKYNAQGINNENVLICANTAFAVAKELKKILPKEVLKVLVSSKSAQL